MRMSNQGMDLVEKPNDGLVRPGVLNLDGERGNAGADSSITYTSA
jgi:hypothetical protein